MATRHNRTQTRATIEKIRQSIDTASAIKELHEIGHDHKHAVSVRVKALQVLLDKTMPSLTAADLNHNMGEEMSLQDKFLALVSQVGEDRARLVYPDLANEFLGPQKPPKLEVA